MLRRQVVSLDRREVVSLVRRQVVNLTVFCSMLYSSFIKQSTKELINSPDNIFSIIEKEENWSNMLDNLNKNTLGLTGLAGVGLGILNAAQSSELRDKQEAGSREQRVAK